MNSFRVGFGYDVHQLAEGEDFVLGGVKIDHTKGTVGHSDADVLLHTISDALLGAANLRDIGYHFPDTNSQYKGIDSQILLKKSFELVQQKGYALGNIDCTVCLQKPKISPYIEEIKQTIADCISCDIDKVSVKATTTEKLGFVGREEGISAYAVVLIEKISE